MRHGPGMSAVRSMVSVVVGCLAVAACSSSSVSSEAPDAGYCFSNGLSPATGGACPKGTCMATGTSVACCGSECPTCESKGLVSYTSAGTCPAGLCPSADVTANLQCCDDQASSLPNGSYCEPPVMDAGAPETATVEAAVDTGVAEASGD
jgi:hypothetical protein